MERKFYQKIWFKNTILISIPTVISAIGVIISLRENMEAITKNTLMIVIVVLMCILIIAVLFFGGQEDKIYEELEGLKVVAAHFENEYKMSSNTILTFSELFGDWSNKIYEFSKNVINKKSVSDKEWNKIGYFDTVCKQCKSMIQSYCNNIDASKISVGFVLYREDENGEEYIHMVSHSDDYSFRPNACKEEERLKDSKYYHAKLIKKEHPGIEIAINNEEILRIFDRISVDTDLTKYTQYIAIPVYCTDNKLLGIFQVDTKYNCIIEKDKTELLKFVAERIIPYTNLIVLIDKINKGLYVTPKKI